MLFLPLVVLILVLSLLSGWAFGLFTDWQESDDLTGKAGVVEVELKEDFPTHPATGADTNKKTFWGLNTGTKRSYVRASIFTQVQYLHEDGTWHTVAFSQDAFQYTVVAPGWINGNDGYWYYSKVLKPGEETTKVQVLDVTTSVPFPPNLIGKQVRLDMQVRLESAQATHDAYKKIFNITKLPDGVELI